jgi:trigger factor
LNGRVQAQVEELAENRVRVRVQVPAADVHHAVEHAASDLSSSVRIPGFRKGKVPMPVLLQRFGKERLYTEAIESHIGGWFWNAAARERLRPVEQPQYDFDLPANDKDDWEFTATVSVQAKPEPPDWTQLEVPYATPELPEELVDAELRALQATVAELAPVEGRPVQDGDTVVVDLVSTGGETRTDYVIELGGGGVVEEVEEGIVGMSAGETKKIEFELADESTQSVTVTVKELKEKVLPPIDDDLARAASEFESLAELRDDIESRLREQIEAEAEAEFRAAAADALVDATKLEPGGPLVESRARELLAGLARQVERRGVNFETYLTMTGTDPQQLVDGLRAEAQRSVSRELVLEAVADKLDLDVPDEEVERVVREQSDGGDDADAVLTSLRESGRFEQLRDDLRLRDALDRVAKEVKRVSPERAGIWTPDKERPATETKLWTPGSKEPA